MFAEISLVVISIMGSALVEKMSPFWKMSPIPPLDHFSYGLLETPLLRNVSVEGGGKLVRLEFDGKLCFELRSPPVSK